MPFENIKTSYESGDIELIWFISYEMLKNFNY
jgi:hypothetical protein